MHNKDIREAAKSAGVCLWQIAEELGIHPYIVVKFIDEGWLGKVNGTFSRLPDE